jgi:hypothetical protein
MEHAYAPAATGDFRPIDVTRLLGKQTFGLKIAAEYRRIKL